MLMQAGSTLGACNRSSTAWVLSVMDLLPTGCCHLPCQHVLLKTQICRLCMCEHVLITSLWCVAIGPDDFLLLNVSLPKRVAL